MGTYMRDWVVWLYLHFTVCIHLPVLNWLFDTC